jgi:hypothetical protein
MAQRTCTYTETTDEGEPKACPNEYLAKGYCRMHYGRWRKWGDPSVKYNRWGEEREAKTKVCGKCKRELPIDCFYKRGDKSPGRAYKCKECWRPTFERERARNLRQYDITLELFNELLARQGGGCAVCGAIQSSKDKKSLAVDHDHATGEVRGLLCSRCNVGIGMFKDEPALLAAAIRYLTAAMPTGQLALFAA